MIIYSNLVGILSSRSTPWTPFLPAFTLWRGLGVVRARDLLSSHVLLWTRPCLLQRNGSLSQELWTKREPVLLLTIQFHLSRVYCFPTVTDAQLAAGTTKMSKMSPIANATSANPEVRDKC